MSDYVPTINDIRHKICYICREEETFDQPEQPPRRWTHPCKCTLIAHESCLLTWIKTSEVQKGISEAAKCPQCGSHYQLERDNPFVLRLLDFANQQLQSTAYGFAWFGIAASAVSVTSFAVWMLAKYGAYAVREFFGEEMYNILLTDNPDNWPYTAFFQLPLIPVGLILSRFNVTTDFLPVLPVMFDVITSTALRWTPPSQNRIAIAAEPPKWPPSPVIFTTVLLPFTRLVYGRIYKRFSRWLLGDRPPPLRVQAGEGRLIIRVAALMGAEDNNNNNNNGEGNQQNPPAPEANPNAAPAPNRQPQPPANNAGQEDGTETAITFSEIGRRIGGALLIPAISNRMGRLLLTLSKHSQLLRKFLAVDYHTRRGPFEYFPSPTRNTGVMKGPLGPLWLFVLYVIRPWPDLNPVWWRNSVGFGIFVVASDCLQLYHQWLVKRDYDSRRIKNRNFAGIDLSTLDLIPGRFPAIRRIGL